MMRTSILCWAGALLLALPGCGGDGTSPTPPTPDVEDCGNGQDDDNDGLADCDDDDCADAQGCTTTSSCGDGALSVGEACDGMNLGGQTCQGLGFAGGSLACTQSCTLDQSGCVSAGTCGNGALDTGEPCDGADLGGQTCEDLGFMGGTLACAADCTLDQSGCSTVLVEVCGNSLDDDMNGLADCQDPACAGDASCDGASCGGAIALSDGVPMMGDTVGGMPMTEGYCTGYNDTTARVYSFTGGSAGESGEVYIVLESASEQGFYVVTDCDDPFNTQIECVDWSPGGIPEEIYIYAQGGQPIYIYVDGTYTSADNGPFTITATWIPGEICGNGIDDNGDGLADCEDFLCASDPSCPEVACEDFDDNDGDSYTDCEDPDCQATMICTPGTGAVGTPCDMNNQCAANNNDPHCWNEPYYGWPMGYCSEFCDPVLDDCAAGALCLDLGLPSGSGICLDECATHADCRPDYYCDTQLGSVCVPGSPPEICGNMVDDNGDGLIDCDDPQCQSDPSCPEMICDDWWDSESDGMMDCADTDCQATMTCAPGMGAVGTPCDMNNQCAANAGDPACLSEMWWGNPMGYCSEWCNLAMDDCGAGALCVDFGFSPTTGLCFDQCATDADCRQGYYCDTAGLGVCLAGSAPELCDNMVDDNGDGLVDCADPQCQGNPICPEMICDDWSDNDGNGLMDCQDAECQMTMTCTPGMGAAGAPCTANNQCASVANSDPFCATEAITGWVGGYCSEFCDTGANDCGAGAVCLDMGVNPPYGNCMDLCNVNADCRPGYTCLDFGMGVNVCWYQ